MLEHGDDLLLLNFSIPLFRDASPLQIAGPTLDNPATIFQFTNIEDWRQHVRGLRLRGDIPEIFRRKHDHVLQVLFLAWLDSAVIKLAELGALATLEAAIKGRYTDQEFRGLEQALEHLLDTGSPVVQNLLRTSKDGSGSGLSEIRNRLAHGDPFEIMPWAGLFEVVRDLIDFMYPSLSQKTST